MEESFFEIHITVNTNYIFNFLLYCNETGCDKDFAVGPWLYPEARSEASSNQQLMYTRTMKTTLKGAVEAAETVQRELERRDVPVVRIKIEVPANHSFVDSHRNLPESYFEFHFKVRITTAEQNDRLRAVCLSHSGSYSYNAFSRTAGCVLATQRVRLSPSQPYSLALECRERFVDDIQSSGLEVVTGSGLHYEYVVYDTNPDLDNGFVGVPLQPPEAG